MMTNNSKMFSIGSLILIYHLHRLFSGCNHYIIRLSLYYIPSVIIYYVTVITHRIGRDNILTHSPKSNLIDIRDTFPTLSLAHHHGASTWNDCEQLGNSHILHGNHMEFYGVLKKLWDSQLSTVMNSPTIPQFTTRLTLDSHIGTSEGWVKIRFI